MEENTKSTARSRRWFLTGGLMDTKNKEMVKMLTPDGKLVEIEKDVLDKVSKKQKSTNKEIYDWMKNPSK